MDLNPTVVAAAAGATRYASDLLARTSEPDARTVLDCRALAVFAGALGDDATRQACRALAGSLPDPDYLASDVLAALVVACDGRAAGGSRALAAADYLDLVQATLCDDVPAGNRALAATALRLPVEASDLPGSALEAAVSGLDHDRFRDLLAAIERGSRFGTARIDADPPLAGLLEGAALAAFRRYDLPLGMRAMRAGAALTERRAPTQSLDFLLLSQDERGGFGDYASAIRASAAAGVANAEARIRLPVCIQALWTLGDLAAAGAGVLSCLFRHGPHPEAQPE